MSPLLALCNALLALSFNLVPVQEIVGCPGTLNLNEFTFNFKSNTKSSKIAETVPFLKELLDFFTVPT